MAFVLFCGAGTVNVVIILLNQDLNSSLCDLFLLEELDNNKKRANMLKNIQKGVRSESEQLER
jgi:hypothetical protein